jgi:hypothetical protein
MGALRDTPPRVATQNRCSLSNAPARPAAIMAAQQRAGSATGMREKTYFEQQREALVSDIAMVRLPHEHVSQARRADYPAIDAELRTCPRQHQ